MHEFDDSPETDSSHCLCAFCASPPGIFMGRRRTTTKCNKRSKKTSSIFLCNDPSVQGEEEEGNLNLDAFNLINENYPNETNDMTSPRRTSLRRKMACSSSTTSSLRRITQHLTPSPSLSLLLFVISAFLISISTSSDVQPSSPPTFGSTASTFLSSNSNPTPPGNNANGRNINNGIFPSNTFPQGFSPFPTTSSSSGGNGNVVPISNAESSNSNSRPTAYFIAGLASQIRKINSTAMMLLTRDKPFQLQFRTVCPFGNIVNDDKFAISINSGGNMTFTSKASEFPSSISHHSVADGRWHSVTFTGDLISLDDHESDPAFGDEQGPPVVHWDSNSSAENEQTTKLNHMLHFFDGFVGCIRVLAPTHDHASGGGNKNKPSSQSHEESYFVPESPSEHQVVSLHDLFQLRTPFAPCNDTDVELSSVHSCFNPDTFVLCNKCQNGATCRPDPTTDNPMNNQCECPPNTEEVEYSGKYCEYPPAPGSEDENDSLLHPSSSDFEDAPEMTDSEEARVPFSAPSNIDLTASNSTLEFSPDRRHEAHLAHMEIATSTTTEAPEEHPFVLEGDCPCTHGGVCVASIAHSGQQYCNCTGTGYEGQYCGEDVNECEVAGICNNGICQNSPGGYQCFCKPGWTGKRCSKNYNECLSNPCKNGTCTDKIDDYLCVCFPGYKGTDCELEIDECESSPCQNSATCTDLIADYECTCIQGFEGKDCHIDIDECQSSPCKNGGACIDKINAFECDCDDTGFEGDHCQVNIDDCRFDSCHNNGTCIDIVKGVKCECQEGFEGKQCDIDIDDCADNPCSQGQCFQKSNESLYFSDIDERIRELLPPYFSYDTAAGYICLCDPGYKGENCDIDIDECALQVNPCGRNGNCKDQINSFKCECLPGFTGERCETEIDECESNPCVRGECLDKVGDFECRCPEGYGAKNCGVLLTGCVRDPCDKVGFAKCNAFYDETTNNHTFECDCKEGFTGRTCNLNTVMSFNGSGPVEIINNDRHYENGNYELLFKFRTTLPDVLLIVGSGITYFYLTLSGGKLNLQSSLLNSLEGISVGQNLSNAELHKVWISVNSTHIALAADSQQTFYPIQTEDVHTGFNVTYIGGGHTNAFVNNPTKKVIKSQFIGCMQDIIMNGESERVIPDFLNSSNIEIGCKRTDQCKPNPCQNSGNCTDLWQNFTCKCLRPYLGERCQHEYVAATFQHESKNNSLVRVDITPEVGTKFVHSFDISMFIRTRKRNGTIFLLGNVGSNFSVFLEAEVGEVGNLVVHAKWSDAADELNSKTEVYAVDGLQITDGYQHLLSIQREKGLVKISVNGTEHFRKSVGNRITFNPSILYLGGKPISYVDLGLNQLDSRVARMLQEDTTEVEDVTETLLEASSSSSPPTTTTTPRTEPPSIEPKSLPQVDEDDQDVPVGSPFKGIIQDVRVNFSATEPVQMALGHGHLQQQIKTQNHYVVEFYPLKINSSYAMGEPLGVVRNQNLVEGVVSDNACKVNDCLNGGTCETTWNDFRCICSEGFDGRLCEHKLPCAIIDCPQQSTCRNLGLDAFECVSDVAFQGTGNDTPHYVFNSHELENITFPSISFRFRTKTPGTVLFMASSSHSVRIGLEEEVDSQNQSVDALVFYIDGERHTSRIRSLLDGRWHTVSAKYLIGEKDTLHLNVDAKEWKLLPPVEIGTISLDPFSAVIKSPGADIIIGSYVEPRERYDTEHHNHDHDGNDVGHPEDAHSHFYRGCLDNIMLGAYRLPFVSTSKLREINGDHPLASNTSPSAFYIVEDGTRPQRELHLGCIVCYEDECQNDGRCTQPKESFECTCAPGFSGRRCDVNIDDCATMPLPCFNGGTCVDAIANFTCNCEPGYEGWRCDVNIDECSFEGAYPCKNGGTCIDLVNAFNCICTEEFLGPTCEKRKRSSCKDSPCENDGRCRDRRPLHNSEVTFECECTEGWEGETCSVKTDYCSDAYHNGKEPCMNGGHCKNKPLGYECTCLLGFEGIRCEHDIDECVEHNQPCNHGQCFQKSNQSLYHPSVDDRIRELLPEYYRFETAAGYVCLCEEGYRGDHCDTDINECEMSGICPMAQACQNLPGTFACHCPDETRCGEYCNFFNPCYNRTCHNGGICRSTCYDEDSIDFQCECLSSYGGELCELLMAESSGQIDLLLIIIPIIAALLIAASISLIILVKMARQKRATRGVYSPQQQEYSNPRLELDCVMKPPPEERLI